MGLMATFYPKPRLSLNPLEHKRFPYLLKGLAIVRPNQVLEHRHHLYSAAGRVCLLWWRYLDWFSRYVLAWELSISLEADFCVVVVERAMAAQRPEILNSDQVGAGIRPARSFCAFLCWPPKCA